MITKQIRKVHIEFEDGTTMDVDVPKDQGFYRERYTYEQTETRKITNRLYVYEIYWTRRAPLDEHGNAKEDQLPHHGNSDKGS